jgi:hypothetical protein
VLRQKGGHPVGGLPSHVTEGGPHRLEDQRFRVGQQQPRDRQGVVDLVVADQEERRGDGGPAAPAVRGGGQFVQRVPWFVEQVPADDPRGGPVDQVPVVDPVVVAEVGVIEGAPVNAFAVSKVVFIRMPRIRVSGPLCRYFRILARSVSELCGRRVSRKASAVRDTREG